MKKYRHIVAFVTCCLVSSQIGCGTSKSIVYNLRISETTKRTRPEQQEAEIVPFDWFASAVILGQARKKYVGNDRHALGGALGSLAYIHPSYYLRVDFAGGRVRTNNDCVFFARAQTDDILFSGGYTRAIRPRKVLTFSGLLGIPTHKDLSPQGTQFGYGHVGLGAQIDGAFGFDNHPHHSIRAAARFIYFVTRTAYDLDCKKYKFHNGDLADLYLTYHYEINRSSFELGYNPSFFFDTKITPSIPLLVPQTEYKRSNFFTDYKYHFRCGEREHPSAITIALSYGHDHPPKEFGYKYIVTAWISFNTNF